MEQISSTDRRRKLMFCFTEFVFGLVAGSLIFNNAFMSNNGMKPSQVGIVMTISSVLGMLAPPFWGMIADVLKSKFKVFVMTLALSAMVAIFVPFTTGIKIFGIMVAGLLIPMVNFFRNPSYSILDTISVAASEQVPGMDYSNVRVWQSIGFTTASFAYVPLMRMWGDGVPYFAFVIFALICLATCKHLKQYEVNGEEEQAVKTGEQSQGLGIGRLFKNYYLIAFLLINIVIHIPVNATQFLYTMFEEIGADANMTGIATGVRTVAEISMLFMAVHIKKKVTLPGIIGLAAILNTLEMALYPHCTSVAMIAAVDMLGGFAFGLSLSAAINYVYMLAPKGLEATTVALYSAGNAIAGIVTNLVAGRMVEILGARAFFSMAAIACAVALAIYLLHFVFGQKVLKKKPPQTMLMRNNIAGNVAVEDEPNKPADPSDTTGA